MDSEDPVEITRAVLRQVQTNKGWAGFATIMRAFLRRPGRDYGREMRDRKLYQSASKFVNRPPVFATLHTNSAPNPSTACWIWAWTHSTSDALLGILAQRLGKRLCGDCKKPHIATADEMKSMLTEYSGELLNTATEERSGCRYQGVYAEWVKLFG